MYVVAAAQIYLDNGELLLYRGFLTSSSPSAEGELEVAFKRCDYDPLPRSSLVDPVVVPSRSPFSA